MTQEQVPQPHTPQQKVFSRRSFLTTAGVIGTVAAVTLPGFRIPSYLHEYLSMTSPRSPRFIFGGHLLPAKYGGSKTLESAFDTYRKRGDLTISVWPDGPLKIIDSGMREAKRSGQNVYMIGVDSNENQVPTDEYRDYWPRWPHPNLFERDAYPETIVMVNTEQPFTFGLDTVNVEQDPQAKQQMDNLMGDLGNIYDPYSDAADEEHLGNYAKAASVDIGGVALTAGLLAKRFGFHSAKSITGVLGVGLFQILKNANLNGILLSSIIGNTSDYHLQQLLTALQTITPQRNFNPKIIKRVNARTAAAWDMANQARAILSQTTKIPHIPLDILYGSGHSFDTPQLQNDSQYRKRLIQDHMKDLLSTADELIQKKYPILAQGKNLDGNYREQILQALAASFSRCSYGVITIPWRKHTIDPSQIDAFETSLLSSLEVQDSPTVTAWVNEVLKEMKIPPLIIA